MLATLNARIALHASQEARLLIADFKTAKREFYGLTMQMEGLANARARGLHPDLEASHAEESRYLRRQIEARGSLEGCLERLEQQLRRELHGSDEPTWRARRLAAKTRSRAAAEGLPRNILGLPTLAPIESGPPVS